MTEQLKPCPCCGYPCDETEARGLDAQLNQIKADAVSDFCFAWRNSRDVGFTEFSSKYIDKLERGEV